MDWKKELYNQVYQLFKDQHADHDFWHINRVLNLALYIGNKEKADRDLVYAAALLHDISDHKLNGGILNDNGRAASELLKSYPLSEEFVEKVAVLVDKVSYKGSQVADEKDGLELAVVRDADRLDAIGAIGIARAFHFGGARNRLLYDPMQTPSSHADFESYAKDKSHTINHFYEKLLLLNDRLETKTAKEIGFKRHALMEHFLTDFLADWNFKFEKGL